MSSTLRAQPSWVRGQGSWVRRAGSTKTVQGKLEGGRRMWLVGHASIRCAVTTGAMTEGLRYYAPPIGSVRTRTRDCSNTTTAPPTRSLSTAGKFAFSNASCFCGCLSAP